MYLLLDGVSTRGYIGVFSQDKKNIYHENFDIAGNESSLTSGIIDAFLLKHDISYDDISNVLCVVGPGSFTGVRSVTLVVNTIAFIHPHICLTPVSFFDLYDNYPILKSSSKSDLFVKYSKSGIICVVKNQDFESASDNSIIYGDTDASRFQKKYVLNSEINYEVVFQKINILQEKRLAPLYIKKPAIT